MSHESDEFNIDYEVALYRFHEKLEDVFVEDYSRRAVENPRLAQFATEEADGAIRGLGEDPELRDAIEPYEKAVRDGFYRIVFDFTKEDESGEFKTVSSEVLARTFWDITKELEYDFAAIAHEWATLSPTMRTWEASQPGRLKSPYEDPETRFAYLFGVVKAIGSATGRLGAYPPGDSSEE